MNNLYGWKGRVHKAVLVFEQRKRDYTRVCALPKSYPYSTCSRSSDHKADVTLAWALLESSGDIVASTCDAYIGSIRRSFNDYERASVKELRVPSERAIAPARAPGHSAGIPASNNVPAENVTLPVTTEEANVRVIVETTIDNNIALMQQWTKIMSDAQNELAAWKSKHEKPLDRLCVVDATIKASASTASTISTLSTSLDNDEIDSDHDESDSEDEYDDESDSEDEYESDDDDDESEYESDDDDDESSYDDEESDSEDDRLRLLRMGTRVDEQADHLYQIGEHVSAGKVLISSLKIARKLESIEAAAKQSGISCIASITKRNLMVSNPNSTNMNTNSNRDDTAGSGNETNGLNGEDTSKPSQNCIFQEWNEQVETSKLNSIFCWYRMFNGTLNPVDTKCSQI